MGIIKYTDRSMRPLQDFEKLMDSMTSGFDDLLHSFGYSPVRGLSNATFIPSLDITENEKEYVATMEVPGLEKEQVKVLADEDGTLTFSGEKVEEYKDDKKHIQERYYGSFHREVRLPANADLANVSVALKNGVLAATVPKKPVKENKNRLLEIK